MAGHEGSSVSQAHSFKEAKDPKPSGYLIGAEMTVSLAFSLETVKRMDQESIKLHSMLCTILQLFRLPSIDGGEPWMGTLTVPLHGLAIQHDRMVEICDTGFGINLSLLSSHTGLRKTSASSL